MNSILITKDYSAPQIHALSDNERIAFEENLADADTPEEVSKLLHASFNIDPAQTKFLSHYDRFGGIEKLRELYFEVIQYDLLHGTNTSSFISEEAYKEMANSSPSSFSDTQNVNLGVKHRASLTRVIADGLTNAHRILQKKGIKTEEASLFDFGTGTGKPILMGMSGELGFQFKKAVGVDYFEPVLADARNNANAMDLKDKVKFVFADASKYKEFNGINVVYMYNPFQEEVMNKVEQNLRRHAGKTLVVYNKPLYGHLFKDKGWSVLHEQNMQHNKAGKPSFDPDLQTQIFSFGFENGPNAP